MAAVTETLFSSATKGKHISQFDILTLSQCIVSSIIGNILSIVVMRREKFRSKSFSCYLFSLSVADTMVLLINPISRRLIGILTGVQLTQINSFMCKFLAYFQAFSSGLSVWFLCAMSIERMLVVAFPHKAKLWFSTKKAWKLIALISVTCGIITMPQLFTYDTIPYFANIICYYVDRWWGFINDTIHMVLHSLLPSLAIAVCNTILIGNMIMSARFCERAGITLSSAEVKIYQLTVMLVVNSFAFLVLTLPIRLFLIYTSLTNDYRVSLQPYHRWLSILKVTNHGINCYIYCISGPMFREELLSIFKCGQRQATAVRHTNCTQRPPIIISALADSTHGTSANVQPATNI